MRLHDAHVRGGLAARRQFGLQQGGPAAQDGKRGAQVVGEGGIQAAALLHLRPVLAVELQQRGAHLLKGLAQPPQLVAAGDLHREAQVVFRDLLRRGVEYLYGPPELAPVEDDGAENYGAEVGDGYGQGLEQAAHIVDGLVLGAVLGHDYHAAHVAHQAALVIGDAAAVHGVVVRVVYDVDLGVVRVAVLGVPALGYGYLLGLVAVFIVELDPRVVQPVYDEGADGGRGEGGDDHVEHEAKAQRHVFEPAPAALVCGLYLAQR